MQGLFEEGIEQFTFYQKPLTDKKSRHEKKFIKIEKLKHDMNDPEQKRQRHVARRTQDKNKLQKQLEGMTQQEKRKYLDDKKDKKKQTKKRIFQALKDGQQIFVDNVFEKKMNQKQNKSLAIQIQLIMKSIRHVKYPPGVHLCSVRGSLQTQLQKMGSNFWPLQSHKQDILQIGKSLNKKLIYLSPDAQSPLQQVSLDTAYIIGGLVDRTIITNATYYRARQLNIQARYLPIRSFMRSRACLNLDHVVIILSKFRECGDWKEAFDYAVPKRWRRDEGQKDEGEVGSDLEEGEQQNDTKQQKIEKVQSQQNQVNQLKNKNVEKILCQQIQQMEIKQQR